MIRRQAVVMGTTVTIEVVRPGAAAAIDRAFEWFHRVESACTRFNPGSELMRLCARVNERVPVSRMLFEALRFALAVAEETGGAFDPTIGGTMEARGFNREYSTGERRNSGIDAAAHVTFRDVVLDPRATTAMVRKPMVLDLGAVAKGLAVDTAALELQPFGDFAIDAGGDMYLGGVNAQGAPWSIGIRHPVLHDQSIEVIRVTDKAVCTSGNYERAVIGTHIVDPRGRASRSTGTSETSDRDNASSATVVAPTAMLADALATAAFVLGPVDGIALLERHGVEGMILSASLERVATPGFGA